MPVQVCHGATLMCSFGAAPSNLVVLPVNQTMTSNAPAANIMDNKPMVNVLPFGVCMTPANPQVAAATAAALGVLTPQPCIPVIPAPWAPGQPTIMIGNQPAVDNTCKLMCQWSGVISVVMPGQMTHLIDGQMGGGGGRPSAASPTGASASASASASVSVSSGAGAGAGVGAGAGAASSVATSATLATPATPTAAPASVNLSAMQPGFDKQWTDSFPGGNSQEHGGTVVSDGNGMLTMTNTGSGASGSFSPNLAVPAGQKVEGIFHTHPYDASEGGHTGVSLSGGDAGYLMSTKQNVIVAQSGNEQFMYMRTGTTPAIVDSMALNNSQNARIGVLTGSGTSFSDASKIAAKETAAANGLAYYEGTGGVLKRVYP